MELGVDNTTVAGDTVTLKGNVTLGDSLTVPEGVTLTVANGNTLKTGGKTITNLGSVNVEGNLDITNTAELAGNGTYTIKAGSTGKLQLNGYNYIANEGLVAIVVADGAVEVSSNANGGYTFNVPADVKVIIDGANDSQSTLYRHGANDVITVEGTLVIEQRFANHGTIDVKENGTLTINMGANIFASPSNNTGTLIFNNSTLNGNGAVEGTDAPATGNLTGTYVWNGTKWITQ